MAFFFPAFRLRRKGPGPQIRDSREYPNPIQYIMKKIEAVIRRTRFEETKEALLENGVEWFSYVDVRDSQGRCNERMAHGLLALYIQNFRKSNGGGQKCPPPLDFVIIELSFDRQCSQSASQQRSHDEYPELCKCRAAFEQGGSYRAGRVNRCSGQRNTNDMDQHECQPDG